MMSKGDDDTVKYGNYENEMWLYPARTRKNKIIVAQRCTLKEVWV